MGHREGAPVHAAVCKRPGSARFAAEMVPLARVPTWLAVLILVGFRLSVSAQALQNVALNKPISGSGPTWPGYPPANLTDGDHTTFTHPQAGAGAGVLGYYFQVDLGQTYVLDRIVLWSRHNCCPERLSKYRVEVYADRGGETGPLNWAADQRTDGTFPATGEADTVTAAARRNERVRLRMGGGKHCSLAVGQNRGHRVTGR